MLRVIGSSGFKAVGKCQSRRRRLGGELLQVKLPNSLALKRLTRGPSQISATEFTALVAEEPLDPLVGNSHRDANAGDLLWCSCVAADGSNPLACVIHTLLRIVFAR